MTVKALKCRKIIYTLCFVALCVIDQIKGSAPGRAQMIAVNCIGLLMAVMILSAYSLRDFLKVPYYIWTGIFLVGGTLAYLWGKTNYPYQGRWVTAILNVGIYGYILIRLFYKFAVEKQPLHVRKPLFFAWCVMLVCMMLSRNEAVWPFWFLVMFGSFYVTDYTPETRKALFDSLINGVLIGFFLVQGAAFLFRPYDDPDMRYYGMYANTNINVLFYAVTYGAWLAKWYRLKCRKANLFLRGVTACFSGAMFGFAFLTIGRAGLLTMAAVTLVFLVYCAMTLPGHKIAGFFGKGALLAAVAVVSFPLVFGCVRYIPAYVHHPIWFEGEYNERKVHSWDPVDSDKYVDFNAFLEESFGRVLWFVDFSKKEARAWLRPAMVVQAADAAGQSEETTESDLLDGTGIDQQHPVLTDPEKMDDPVVIRTTIHKYYLDRLNLRGHKQEENGFWLKDIYYAPHAHNILLQFAFDFGIIPGLLFAVIAVWAAVLALREAKNSSPEERQTHFLYLTYAVILFAFGMLEHSWGVGQNSLTLYFVTLYAMMHSLSVSGCEKR